MRFLVAMILGWPPQPGPEGSQKILGGSALKIFRLRRLCHRPDLVKEALFRARLPKITSAPQANAPRRRAKSAAQRDFGVFWALKGQNRTAARAR